MFKQTESDQKIREKSLSHVSKPLQDLLTIFFRFPGIFLSDIILIYGGKIDTHYEIIGVD